MTQLKGGFLGALLATLAWMEIDLHPSPTPETQVGIRYGDHSHDPLVVLGVREHGNQYTYMLTLRLISQGDSYQVPCDVKRIEMSDPDWEFWRRIDTNPWEPGR
ncbi:MAG TPA: hypothetical protein VMU54_09635 [Planctomycetota bacterium]|nr:hypothetical protein [Planctomycetota bacterium]